MAKGKDIYSFLAQRIRQEREKTRLSREELADAARISPSFLAYIENDSKKPSLATIEKLAAALKLPVAELFKLADNKGDGTDYPMVRQFTFLIHDKNSSQKKVILDTLKTLSKSLKGIGR